MRSGMPDLFLYEHCERYRANIGVSRSSFQARLRVILHKFQTRACRPPFSCPPLVGSTAMNRRLGLDGLRGVAVGMVLIFHYTSGFENIVRPHAPGLLFRFPAGTYGVNLFFMISGYVILMTVERTRRARDFALARFVRLYPPFLA